MPARMRTRAARAPDGVHRTDTAPRAYEEGGQYGEQNSLGHTAAAEVVDAVIAAYDLAAR